MPSCAWVDDIASLKPALEARTPFLINLTAVVPGFDRDFSDDLWEILPPATPMQLAVMPTEEVYNHSVDPESPIGLRRTMPAVLEDVPWGVLASFYRHIAARDLDPATPLPESLREQAYLPHSNVFDDPPVPLAKLAERLDLRFYSNNGQVEERTALRRLARH